MEHKIVIEMEQESWKGTVEEIEHPIHQMYYVCFDHGYKNVFFTDAETGRWIEQDIGETELAVNIGRKLACFHSSLEIRPLIHINWFKQLVDGRLISFGYHSYWIEGFAAFEIFAPNRRFMYTLIKLYDNHWKIIRMLQIDWRGYNSSLCDLPLVLEKYVLSE